MSTRAKSNGVRKKTRGPQKYVRIAAQTYDQPCARELPRICVPAWQNAWRAA